MRYRLWRFRSFLDCNSSRLLHDGVLVHLRFRTHRHGTWLLLRKDAGNAFVPMSNASEFDRLGGNAPWSNLLKAYTDQDGPICWNPDLRYYFLALLLTLQVFCLIWFGTIAKVVYKVLKGNAAEDIRSDDEDEDEEIEEEKTNTIMNMATTGTETGMSQPPLEEEVGVDALTFARLNGASQRRQTRRE